MKRKYISLLGKFGQSKHEKYANNVLPRNTVRKLSEKIFVDKNSTQDGSALTWKKKVGRIILLLLGLSIECLKGLN